jgi:hypothetical protein
MLALPAGAGSASTLQAFNACKALHFPPGARHVSLLD